MKIICIGDSLTFGYGVPISNCWVNLLKANCPYDIINKGVNGDTTSSILCRSYKDIIEQSPDYAFIMAGTNDFLMNLEFEYAFNNLLLLYNEVLEEGIIPIPITPPPVVPSLATVKWSSYIDYNSVNRKLNLLKEYIAEYSIMKSLPYFDLYSAFKEAMENPEHLYIDGIHPTSKGHFFVYQEIKKLKIFNAK